MQRKLTYYCGTDIFKKFFPLHVISEWNIIRPGFRNSDSFLEFRKHILNLARAYPIPTYNIYNPVSLKYFNRLCFELGHLLT